MMKMRLLLDMTLRSMECNPVAFRQRCRAVLRDSGYIEEDWLCRFIYLSLALPPEQQGPGARLLFSADTRS
jgi:hypothetical protein